MAITYNGTHSAQSARFSIILNGQVAIKKFSTPLRFFYLFHFVQELPSFRFDLSENFPFISFFFLFMLQAGGQSKLITS